MRSINSCTEDSNSRIFKSTENVIEAMEEFSKERNSVDTVAILVTDTTSDNKNGESTKGQVGLIHPKFAIFISTGLH